MEKLRIFINTLLAHMGYKITKADAPGTMGRRAWDNHMMEIHRELIRGQVLDVGSGDSGWSRKEFGEQCDLTTFDQFQGSNIDVTGDLLKLSSHFAADSFDVVICMEVFEHVSRPFKAIEQIRAVMKKGGILLATTPFEHGLHGEEYGDYFRYTRQGWKELLKDFSEVREISWLGPELTPKQYFVYAIK